MSKRKKRRQKDRPLLERLTRRQKRWARNVAVLGVVAAGLALIVFLADPFAGPPTAIDANGQEVEAGVIDTPGAFPRVGITAPDFLLPDYEQAAVQLSDFQGKVVFVNFWASWCTFCEEEMADIVRVAEEYPDELVVLAVNRGESKSTARGWTEALGFPALPNMHWVLDEREDVTDEYRVGGMPQSFVIGPDGTVWEEIRRVTEYREIRDAVEQVLATASGEAS